MSNKEALRLFLVDCETCKMEKLNHCEICQNKNAIELLQERIADQDIPYMCKKDYQEDNLPD